MLLPANLSTGYISTILDSTRQLQRFVHEAFLLGIDSRQPISHTDRTTSVFYLHFQLVIITFDITGELLTLNIANTLTGAGLTFGLLVECLTNLLEGGGVTGVTICVN
eukprot:sb/3477588/